MFISKIDKPAIEEILYRKNLFMKEKLNKKNNINYIHYLQYTEEILLAKQINSSTIANLLIYSASNITYLSGHGQRLIHYCMLRI